MKLNLLFVTLDDIMVLEFIAYSLEESLENKNVNIFDASNEKTALEILNTENIHLVVVDMNIENINSSKFYNQIKNDKNIQNIPFIFLSSEINDKKIIDLKENYKFFLKPLNVQELLQTLQETLLSTTK